MNAPLLAFAALGDGTAAALVTDLAPNAATAAQQVFRPIDTQAAGASVTSSNLPACSATVTTGCYDPGSLTEGITRSETIRATFRGTLPGLAGRTGTFTSTAGTFSLADPAGGLDQALAGDLVRATLVGEPCAGVTSPFELTVTAVAPRELTVSAPAGFPSTCAALRVSYDVVAAGAQPWTIAGEVTGPVGRAASGEVVSVTGRRLFYPPTTPPQPANAVALRFTLPPTDPADGTSLAITTSSGWLPFALPSGANALATSVAALPDRLFLSILSGAVSSSSSLFNTFVDVTLSAANTTAGVVSYR